MIEAVLVRHAATDWSGSRYAGRSDRRLSSNGRADATALAARLSPTLLSGTTIVSSPARRARATADHIARAAGLDRPEIDPRWWEADLGSADGLTFDELEAIDPSLATRLARGDVDIDWPGGETAAAVTQRVREAWAELVRRARPFVVVSHAGPLRIAVAVATGIPPERVAFLEPAGVLRLALAPGRRATLRR